MRSRGAEDEDDEEGWDIHRCLRGDTCEAVPAIGKGWARTFGEGVDMADPRE